MYSRSAKEMRSPCCSFPCHPHQVFFRLCTFHLSNPDPSENILPLFSEFCMNTADHIPIDTDIRLPSFFSYPGFFTIQQNINILLRIQTDQNCYLNIFPCCKIQVPISSSKSSDTCDFFRSPFGNFPFESLPHK